MTSNTYSWTLVRACWVVCTSMYFFFLLPHQWTEWHLGEVQVITWDIQPQWKVARYIGFLSALWRLCPHMYYAWLYTPFKPCLINVAPTLVPLYIPLFFFLQNTDSQKTHYNFPLNTTQEADTLVLVRVWQQSKFVKVSIVFFKPNTVQWVVVLAAVLVVFRPLTNLFAAEHDI